MRNIIILHQLILLSEHAIHPVIIIIHILHHLHSEIQVGLHVLVILTEESTVVRSNHSHHVCSQRTSTREGVVIA